MERSHFSGKAARIAIFAMFLFALPCAAQNSSTDAPAASATQPAVSPEQAKLLKSTEAFARELFGWGPNVKVKLGPLTQSTAADFYVVPIDVAMNDQHETGEVYVSKDGKTLLRGEIYDMGVDPFADNRAKLHTDGSPSKGPADAKVTIVEFADFECPHCAELAEALKAVEARYPQVRVVYKDFPLLNIHPWAQTAAFGAHCAFEQSPAAFWKVHDSIFENQDVISTENIWDKLVQYATEAGLNADTFKACLSSPDTQKAIDASRAEGLALTVNSTPTVFVNGRPMVGPTADQLSQYIDFELAAQNHEGKQSSQK
jgi:protein-disulfide isomerase